jgi:hypothetical protein
MKRMLGVITVGFAICALSATCVQAQQSYLLRSNGEVRVNGVAVPGTAVVSPGDLIETSKGSIAKIAAPGMSMLVGEDSKVSVKAGFLGVDRGSAAVSSNGGIMTGASQYSIAPEGTNAAKYQIANVGGAVSVSSEKGGLTIMGPNSAATNVLSGRKTMLTSASANSVHTSSALLDSSSVKFQQVSAPAISGVCRTAKECSCKTATQCGASLQ